MSMHVIETIDLGSKDFLQSPRRRPHLNTIPGDLTSKPLIKVQLAMDACNRQLRKVYRDLRSRTHIHKVLAKNSNAAGC